MGKLKVINSNMFQKVSTGADFNRQLGVLKDTIVKVTSAQAASRIIPTGFKYLMGTYELEVFVNGTFKRKNETVEGVVIGDYLEYSNFSVLFGSGVINTNDIIRFRVTSANYKIVNTSWAGSVDPSIVTQLQTDVSALVLSNTNAVSNIQQIGRDSFGYNYSFSTNPAGSTRVIGTMSDADATPDLANYRVWRTSDAGATITNFDGCVSEDVRYIIFKNGLTTIQNNANIVLSKGSNLIGTTDRMIMIMYDGTKWIEIGSASISKVSDILSGADWTLDGSGLYYGDIDITSISSFDITITCYNNTTNEVLQPRKIDITSNTNIRIWMTLNTTDVKVIVIG